MFLGAQETCLIETVPGSLEDTEHMFGLRNKKINFLLHTLN